MKGKSPLFAHYGHESNQGQLGQGISSQTAHEPQNSSHESGDKTISPKGGELISRATQPETKELIQQLYRPGASIGDGGTADALRQESAGKIPSGNEKHYLKTVQRVKQIERILMKNPNHTDSSLLRELLNDLKNALKGK